MSGIYIKNMEMPTCATCQLESFCNKWASHDAEWQKQHRDENCPLIPIPNHGRLIDAIAEADKTIDYTRGLEDAWNAAGKIFCGYNHVHMLEVFCEGTQDPLEKRLFSSYSPQEAIEKLQEYEKEQEKKIKIGDEVEVWDGRVRAFLKYICLAESDNCEDRVVGIDRMGSLFERLKSDCKKTGRHFNVLKMLNELESEE